MAWPYSFPNTRKDLFNAVPQASDSTCVAMAKALLRLPFLLFNCLRQMWDENGNVTATFLSMIYSPGDLKASFVAPNPTAQKGVWLKCDGTLYSKDQYPDLYAAIGDLFGTQTNPNVFTYDASGNKIITAVSAPASGLFRVPDMRALGLVGVGTYGSGQVVQNGVAYGEELHQLVAGEDVPHQHDLFAPGSSTARIAVATNNYAIANFAVGANDDYFMAGVAALPTVGMSSIEGGQPSSQNSPGVVAFNVATGDGSASTEQTYYAAKPHNNLPPSIGCYFYIFAGVPVTANTTSTDQTLTPI